MKQNGSIIHQSQARYEPATSLLSEAFAEHTKYFLYRDKSLKNLLKTI